MILAGWLYANHVDQWWPRIAILLVDSALLAGSVGGILASKRRRREIVETIWNINEALKLYEVGFYLPGKAINPEERKHRRFYWYVIFAVIGFIGVVLMLVTPSHASTSRAPPYSSGSVENRSG
jgi:hypothetical protein